MSAKPNFWPTPPRKVANRYEYGSLVFWAEGGGIYMLEQEPDPGERALKPIMLPGWQARTIAQLELYKHAVKDSHVGDPQTLKWKAQYVRALRGLIEAMYEVGNEAIRQGDLSRPEVQRYYREHVAPVKQTHLVPDMVPGVLLPQ